MDTILQTPAATAFDAWSGIASAAVNLVVGIAAVAHASRDVRARVFLVIAVASLAPYLTPAAIWRFGSSRVLSGAVFIVVSISLAVGSVALFHFTQVFPNRRPWARAHSRWLGAGYAVLPGLAAGTGWLLARLLTMTTVSTSDYSGFEQTTMSPAAALALLAIGMPSIFVVGVVLPFAGLMSLYKSWREAKAEKRDGARASTLWILVSQLAGGVLTILIVPLLHLVAPRGPCVMIASGLLFACGLLMPIGFALGVWKYRILALDTALPPGQT